MPPKRTRHPTTYSELPQAKKDQYNAKRRQKQNSITNTEEQLITIPLEQDESLQDIFSGKVRTEFEDRNKQRAPDICSIHNATTSTLGIC